VAEASRTIAALTESRAHLIGAGPLTARRVIGDALAMLRQSFWRISGVALIFFALPALMTVVAQSIITNQDGDRPLLFVIALLVAVSLRVLGPVAFAGFLDEAVAKEFHHGHHKSLAEVMRELPWRRLIVADVIVVIAVGIGMALFVVPGLVEFGLFGMVGAVIVQERAGVAASFRRTVSLAISAPALVALLVVVPFAFEEILHLVIYETLHSSGVGVQLVTEWIIAILVGGTLGLFEVALATELMARNPQGAQLLDDGKAPAV
jgi:hypothetical protein